MKLKHVINQPQRAAKVGKRRRSEVWGKDHTYLRQKGPVPSLLAAATSSYIGRRTSQRRKETTPTLWKGAAKHKSQYITIISSRVLRPQFTMILPNRCKNYSGQVWLILISQICVILQVQSRLIIVSFFLFDCSGFQNEQIMFLCFFTQKNLKNR